MSTDQRHLHRFNPPKPSRRPSSLSELTILQKHHQFIRDDDDEQHAPGPSQRKGAMTWEDKLAVSWYKKLFREYALCDLSQYKTGGIAMRWRTEEEVLDRIGELTCGSLMCKHHTPVFQAPEDDDDERPLVPRDIAPYQLNFGYLEQGKQKHALVKVMLCAKCKKRLTWKKDREKEAALAEATLNSRQAGRRVSEEASEDKAQAKRNCERPSLQIKEKRQTDMHQQRERHRQTDNGANSPKHNKQRGRSRSPQGRKGRD